MTTPKTRTRNRRARAKKITIANKIETVLVRARLDADAKRAYYDDTDGFVVYTEREFGKPFWRYVFKDVEEAYRAATRGHNLRRYRWD